jgi:cyclophilin family peptidyl-prolyl cis-trans isomerase
MFVVLFVQGAAPSGGARLHLKGTRFHRIVPGQCVQGGDVGSGDGKTSVSVYAGSRDADAWGKFKDESFALANDRGCLSMANGGPNGNGSQFFVCLKRGKSWDGKHVVFGRVVSGLRLFDRISREVNVDASSSHRPLPGFSVTVEDCGVMPGWYVPPPQAEPLRVEGAAASAVSGSTSVAVLGAAAPASLAGAAPAGGVGTPAPPHAAAAPPVVAVAPMMATSDGAHSVPPATASSGRQYVFLTVRLSTPVDPEGVTQRVVFELFGDVVPMTANNFKCLCTGEKV